MYLFKFEKQKNKFFFVNFFDNIKNNSLGLLKIFFPLQLHTYILRDVEIFFILNQNEHEQCGGLMKILTHKCTNENEKMENMNENENIPLEIETHMNETG